MTEYEAKTKHCCGPSDCGVIEADAISVRSRHCIGFACMAWRWDWIEFRTDDPHDGDFGQYEKSETSGHCGLAGEP